jgi:GT2 family glycosyltransferase
MTVYVLIPVFNRVDHTRKVLDCLRAQIVDELINLIVINDGSLDGTSDFLATQDDVHTIMGDGSLWWGGAIEVGLQYALKKATDADWVLLINNDTHFKSDFVQQLLNTARAYHPAAIGSVIRDEIILNKLLSIGGMLDSWRLRITDKLLLESQPLSNSVHQVDVLSGRGTLYPVEVFKRAGTMRPHLLPHYLADYELSVRARSVGFNLLICDKAFTFSADDYGNGYRPSSIKDKYLSVRSPYYLPANMAFWWGCSTPFERLTFLPRVFFIMIKKYWISL